MTPSERTTKSLEAAGLVAALDWLQANEPTRANVWADVGPSLRRLPARLLDRVRDLASTDRALWQDIETALHAITDELTRRLRGGK